MISPFCKASTIPGPCWSWDFSWQLDEISLLGLLWPPGVQLVSQETTTVLFKNGSECCLLGQRKQDFSKAKARRMDGRHRSRGLTEWSLTPLSMLPLSCGESQLSLWTMTTLVYTFGGNLFLLLIHANASHSQCPVMIRGVNLRAAALSSRHDLSNISLLTCSMGQRQCLLYSSALSCRAIHPM